MLSLFDFFSGCGGTSTGFTQAGIHVLGGLDNDPDAATTYQYNFPDAAFEHRDIRELENDSLDPILGHVNSEDLIFSACAPCQPFSKQSFIRKADDSRVELIWEVVRFIDRYLPNYLFFENVPGIQKLRSNSGTFKQLVGTLEELGYNIKFAKIESRRFGVPQRRSRLVLVGSRQGTIDIPAPTHGPDTEHPEYSNIWDWIGRLPKLEAGQSDSQDPMHRAANLSPLNMERIKATPEGGDRRDWPPELLAECHRNGYSGHTDVYGRMHKDRPVSGLTTRCISYSNGRFGHPTQDRAISVREAACIQTFPPAYRFFGNLNSMARQVGNAVPVLMAERFGLNFAEHHRLRMTQVPHQELNGIEYGSV